MISDHYDDDWPERLRAAVEKTIHNRQRRAALRRQLAEARQHGLTRRHQTKLDRIKEELMPTMPWPTTATTATIGTPPTSRTIRCRYLRRGTAGQCTAEAVDENGEILLCTKHLSRALELVRHRLPQ